MGPFAATAGTGSDSARRGRLVALPQVFAYVFDGIAQKLGHTLARALRRAVAYRFKDRLVLVEPIILDMGSPLPAQAKGDFERGLDEPGERGEEAVVGRLEDGGVEVEVRADEVAGAAFEPLHAAIGVGDSVDRRGRGRERGERRRLRLDHLAQREQFADEM